MHHSLSDLVSLVLTQINPKEPTLNNTVIFHTKFVPINAVEDKQNLQDAKVDTQARYSS